MRRRRNSMNRQREAAAAKLPEGEPRETFLRLHDEALVVMREAGRLMRVAWAYYRQFIPHDANSLRRARKLAEKKEARVTKTSEQVQE
jgi:hypothetical protein